MSDTTTNDLDNYNPATGEIIEDGPDSGALAIQNTIRDLQSGQVDVFSTVVGDDFAAKATVLNAVTSAEKIRDNVGKHIDLVNIVVQAVKVAIKDPKTGEIEKVTNPRVILLDKNGKAYYGISMPMLEAVKTFIGILGQPSTWPETGVPMMVRRDTSRNGFEFYNLVLDMNPAGKK